MSAEVHLFPDPNPTDLPILNVLEWDYAKEAFADVPSWRARAQVANNMICDSLHRFANRLSDSDDKFDPKEAEFMEFLLLALHIAIADLVAASGAAAPDCDESARLFALSADPVHRRVARTYTLAHDLNAGRLVRGSDLDGLRLLANATDAAQPGLGEFYRQLGDRKSCPAT